MTHADGLAWLSYKAQYRQRFDHDFPDWACAMEVSRKLQLVRLACGVGMPLGAARLVRDEALDPGSQWG